MKRVLGSSLGASVVIVILKPSILDFTIAFGRILLQ